MKKILRCDNPADNMVLKVFFIISFPPCVPSYHPRLTSSWRNVVFSTAQGNSATNIGKTSQKGAPEPERPNRSVVIKKKYKGLILI